MRCDCRTDFNYLHGKQLCTICQITDFPLTIQNSFLILGRVWSSPQWWYFSWNWVKTIDSTWWSRDSITRWLFCFNVLEWRMPLPPLMSLLIKIGDKFKIFCALQLLAVILTLCSCNVKASCYTRANILFSIQYICI